MNYPALGRFEASHARGSTAAATPSGSRRKISVMRVNKEGRKVAMTCRSDDQDSARVDVDV